MIPAKLERRLIATVNIQSLLRQACNRLDMPDPIYRMVKNTVLGGRWAYHHLVSLVPPDSDTAVVVASRVTFDQTMSKTTRHVLDCAVCADFSEATSTIIASTSSTSGESASMTWVEILWPWRPGWKSFDSKTSSYDAKTGGSSDESRGIVRWCDGRILECGEGAKKRGVGMCSMWRLTLDGKIVEIQV
ncbi:hypothetical protein PIB30_083694 [Stylosanthes scabra]|uniref:Uncharacterized protein n=1 Tax=Stylosanthes scabra TaxID=79078 RepID=A0ABU6VRI0_9FABA|nr:hypothetical protein [Stylosanthes scabra]